MDTRPDNTEPARDHEGPPERYLRVAADIAKPPSAEARPAAYDLPGDAPPSLQ